MIGLFYCITALYAVLTIAAPLTKLRLWKSYPSLCSMFVGGMTLGNSLVLKSEGFQNAWILAILALVCISLSAWKNSSMQQKRNNLHHLVRAGLSILIVLGFLFC